jgi:hypothetical protein
LLCEGADMVRHMIAESNIDLSMLSEIAIRYRDKQNNSKRKLICGFENMPSLLRIDRHISLIIMVSMRMGIKSHYLVLH